MIFNNITLYKRVKQVGDGYRPPRSAKVFVDTVVGTCNNRTAGKPAVVSAKALIQKCPQCGEYTAVVSLLNKADCTCWFAWASCSCGWAGHI